MKRATVLVVSLVSIILAATMVTAAAAPRADQNHARRTPTPTAPLPPTATPQVTATSQATAVPTSTAQPLSVYTAGMSCSNGVCIFGPGNVGTFFNEYATSTGGSGPTPYTWRLIAGSLPAGLSMTNFGVYSAQISGTPTQAGTSTFTLQVTDGGGDTAQQAFTLTIDPPASLVITLPGPTAQSGTVGTAYNQNLFANGGVQPYTWSITGGQLPPGLRVSRLQNGGSAINGTPTTRGTFTFTLTVTDNAHAQTSQSTTITVN